MDEVPFWEFFGRLFGGKVPPDRLAAWGEVWASRGYQNRDMVAAIRQLAKTPADTRPTYPDDYIAWIELTMRRAVVADAIAGRIGRDRMVTLSGEIAAETQAAQKAAKEAGASLPDIETPELKRYRQVRALSRQVSALALEHKQKAGLGEFLEMIQKPPVRSVFEGE